MNNNCITRKIKKMLESVEKVSNFLIYNKKSGGKKELHSWGYKFIGIFII